MTSISTLSMVLRCESIPEVVSLVQTCCATAFATCQPEAHAARTSYMQNGFNHVVIF